MGILVSKPDNLLAFFILFKNQNHFEIIMKIELETALDRNIPILNKICTFMPHRSTFGHTTDKKVFYRFTILCSAI